jgi:hypothetical protein
MAMAAMGSSGRGALEKGAGERGAGEGGGRAACLRVVSPEHNINDSNAHVTHQNLLTMVAWIAAEFYCAGPLNFSPFPRETRMVLTLSQINQFLGSLLVKLFKFDIFFEKDNIYNIAHYEMMPV